MSELEGGIQPLVIIDAEALILSDPGLLELAMAVGAPCAIQELLARLAKAAPNLGQPVMLVVDERHVAELPKGTEPWRPGMSLTLLALVTQRGLTRERILRDMVALHVSEGFPVEYVASQEQLANELDLLGGISATPAAFHERLARALGRHRADVIRAQQALADKDGLVAGLIEASLQPPTTDNSGLAEPPGEAHESGAPREDLDSGRESKAA